MSAFREVLGMTREEVIARLQELQDQLDHEHTRQLAGFPRPNEERPIFEWIDE